MNRLELDQFVGKGSVTEQCCLVISGLGYWLPIFHICVYDVFYSCSCVPDVVSRGHFMGDYVWY